MRRLVWVNIDYFAGWLVLAESRLQMGFQSNRIHLKGLIRHQQRFFFSSFSWTQSTCSPVYQVCGILVPLIYHLNKTITKNYDQFEGGKKKQ